MAQKINVILDDVLEKIQPSKKELADVRDSLNKVLEVIKKRLKTLKIRAEIFVGGSFAKNTLIKKDYYDIDIFLRFPREYKDISNLVKKITKPMNNVSRVHGSRDYFRIKSGKGVYFEIIPVLKIKNQRQAENITDLSYSHVKYIKKKIKSEKLLNDIMIAKAFCYANNCYGAESYINGFSGYGLELLIYQYKGFLRFIRAMSKVKKDKIIIDIEKQYKNKGQVLMDINSSKLQSPVILIDPTYKQRNVLAALSDETFERFKKQCKKFLKNPNLKAFEVQRINLEKIKTDAKKKKYGFILLQAKTQKQEGDIAGSKLLKFYRHLSFEIDKFYQIKSRGFAYNEKKAARYFFVVKQKKEVLVGGPMIKDKKNLIAFKKKHKSTFKKKNRIYAREKPEPNINKFIQGWKNKNKKKIKDMYINKLEIIE